MRRLFLLFLFWNLVSLFPKKSWGQVSFHDARVDKYGQLEQVLGNKWNSIDSLIIHGPINKADFTTMWKCAFEGNLSALNLEFARVENNKIPDYALYNPNKQWVNDGEYKSPIYTKVKNIILPNEVTEIGSFAFTQMKLEKINFPRSLTKFNEGSFMGCHWLNVDPLIIPEGITEIPFSCFAHCQNFKKLVLPSTLKTIDGFAFYNTRMECINFPEILDSIGIAAFQGSGELKAIYLPNSLTKIGAGVFALNDSLKEIHISSKITRIPNRFVAYSNSVKKVIIPESVIEIGNSSFQFCTKLTHIPFPSGLRIIRANAFQNCAFDSIVFPATVEYIEGGAFSNLHYLQKVYSLSETPPVCTEHPAGINPGKGPFHGFTPNDIPVYVPIGSGEKYRQAFGWSYFTNIIETDKFPTGIDSPQEDNTEEYKVYAKDGRLMIEVSDVPSYPLRYSIYSIDGETIEQGYLTVSHTIQMKSGIYIVCIGKTTHKILL